MYYNIQQRKARCDQQITPVGIADATALIITGVHLRFSYSPSPLFRNLACMPDFESVSLIGPTCSDSVLAYLGCLSHLSIVYFAEDHLC